MGLNRLMLLRSVLVGALLIVVVLAPLTSGAAQIDAQKIYQKSEPAVIYIETAEKGTGFIVSPGGCIFTAAHVVGSETQEKIMVRLQDGRIFDQVHIVSFDGKNDVAILKIQAADDLPLVELGDSDVVHELDEVVTIGFPRPDFLPADVPTADVGRVQSIRQEPLEYSIGLGRRAIIEGAIQVSGTIRPGSSGGPVFNADGKVIGVIVTVPTTAELSSTAFASPINRAPLPRACASPGATSSLGWLTPVALILGLVIVGSVGYLTFQRRRKPNILELLKGISLFSQLTDVELKGLRDHCELQEFSTGNAIIQEGDLDNPKSFLIVEGQVEIRSGDRLVGKRGVGRTIGEMAFLLGGPRSADVVALKKTRCLVLTQESLRNLIQVHPDVGLKMMSDFVHRLSEVNPSLREQ